MGKEEKIVRECYFHMHIFLPRIFLLLTWECFLEETMYLVSQILLDSILGKMKNSMICTVKRI